MAKSMNSNSHWGQFPSRWLSTAALFIILFQWSLGLIRTNQQLFSFMLRDGKRVLSSTNTVHFLSASFPTSQETDAVDQLEKFTTLIRKAGIFDDNNLHVYTKIPDWITSDTRWSRHLRFLQNSTDDSNLGAGYRFWKPLLLLHHLQDSSVRDGDFVIYADPSRPDMIQWIALLREVMTYRKADLALEQRSQDLERRFSKPDLYYHYLCRHTFSDEDEDVVKGNKKHHTWQMEAASDVSMQYDASFVIVRRNAKTLQFVQDWVDAAQRFELISDEKTEVTPSPDFQKHNHEKSLLSLLLKCKYGEPAKSFLFNNTSLQQSGDSHTFTFQLDGPVVESTI